MLVVTTTVVLLLRDYSLEQGAAFGLILDFTGGIAGSGISYIMPAILYLTLTPKNQAVYYYPCIGMLFFGCFAAVTVPVVSLLNYHTSGK